MPAPQSTMTPAECARLGDEIFERVVRPQLGDANDGKVVAIDVNSEEYALGSNAVDASDALLARVPDAEIWFVRVGHEALHRIGGHTGAGRR